ncbi:hypothetical protein [Nocardioides rubriscoriae]|uniref:hypothetical protein n=1 Tax=Nocardioides rubriscoriae TaxID=642762 RepID=UPI0011DF519E|nr:hypothetical protein [Nocardioides rubriscoriae]
MNHQKAMLTTYNELIRVLEYEFGDSGEHRIATSPELIADVLLDYFEISLKPELDLSRILS